MSDHTSEAGAYREALRALLGEYERRRRSVAQRAMALDSKALAQLLPEHRGELEDAEARIARLPSTREELDVAEGALDIYEKHVDLALSVIMELSEKRADKRAADALARPRRRRNVLVTAACLGIMVAGLVAWSRYADQEVVIAAMTPVPNAPPATPTLLPVPTAAMTPVPNAPPSTPTLLPVPTAAMTPAPNAPHGAVVSDDGCTAGAPTVEALCKCLLSEMSDNPAFCRTEPVSTKLGTPQLSVVGYAAGCIGGDECCNTYERVLVAHDGGTFRSVAKLGLTHNICAGCCSEQADVLGGETSTIGSRSVVVVKSTQSDDRKATFYGPFCAATMNLETVCALGVGARPTRCVSVPVGIDMGCDCDGPKPAGVEASEWADCLKSKYHTEAHLTWSLSADGAVVVKEVKASGDMSKALEDFTNMPDVHEGVIGSHSLF